METAMITAEKLLSLATAYGGITVDPRTGEVPSRGYVVGAGFLASLNQVEDVAVFVDTAARALQLAAERGLLVSIRTEGNDYIFELMETVEDLDCAVDLARLRGETSIFSCFSQTELAINPGTR